MKNGDLSIRIKIADREYPMKVAANNEEKIRIAGKIINDKLKNYREQFGIDDKQDLLAMVAFDCVVEKLHTEQHQHENESFVNEKLMSLNNLIAQEIK
ncbi:MAG: cell division protein ZapA [Cyclobacteriaceae bacterium]